MSAARKVAPALQPSLTVRELVAMLARENPDAVVCWNPGGSCVAHALFANVTRAKGKPIREGTFSLIGPPSEKIVPIVLLDIEAE